MEYIKLLLWKHRERIKAAPNANAELTYVLYEHIWEKIKAIVDKKYIHHGHIMILGGIQINVDPDDYFEPKFCVLMEDSGTKDILEDIKAFDSIPKGTARGE
jgi:hypothetical protein